MSRVFVSILEASPMVEREYGLTAARSSPNPVLKIRAVFPVTLVIKPDAPIVPNQFLKRSVHRARFPDFANDLQGHRTVLVHVVPFESNLQALRHAIVSPGFESNPHNFHQWSNDLKTE
jgi:hypothetical protein